MDINGITQFISNVGFPIVVCIYLFRQNDKLREALDSNTKVIASLKTMLEVKLGVTTKGDE